MEIPNSITAILSRLEQAGYEAYIVGGCVRDSLMGHQPHDFDITTSALPEETMQVFSDMRVIPTGLKHGTVTVLVQGEPIEITTYRIDGEYPDGRHPEEVQFTRSLSEDVARRDFTMNGIAYSPLRGMYDAYSGAEDIRRGLIRCIGEPDKRFGEDALRILRALRFSAVLCFDIEESTAQSLRNNRGLLARVSGERIFIELQKLLCGANAGAVLRGYPEVFAQIIPPLSACIGYDQHSRYHSLTLYEHIVKAVENTPPDAGLRLAMLLHDIGKPLTQSEDDSGEWHYYAHAEKSAELAAQVLDSFHCSNAMKARITEIIRYHGLVPENTDKFIRRRLSKHGHDMFRDIMLAHIADDSAKQEFAKERIPLWQEIIRRAQEITGQQPCLTIKSLAISGNDLTAMIPPSPKIGETLKYLLDGVVDGSFPNNHDFLMQKAKEYIFG
ncbi:MAG: CCA tRNA nucleotidyltransferase [Oscillospiraceae bacterium]